MCYSVTTDGIFYILTKTLVSSYKKDIILNRNNSFFEAFLYPYIEMDTLEKLESKDIISTIFKFLANCAKIVDSVVVDKLLKVDKNNGERAMIGFPNSLLIPEAEEDDDTGCTYAPIMSLGYWSKRYNISWLAENSVKIRDEITQDNKKIIRISNEKGNKEEELILNLYPETNKAILLDKKNNHKIAEFEIEKHPFEKNSYIMWDLIPVTVSRHLDDLFSNRLFYFYHDIEYAVNKLCFDILQYIRYDNYLSDDEFNERQGDCNILVNDKKFRKLANDAKGKFDPYFFHELELNPLPILS